MGKEKLQKIYDRGDFYFTYKGVPRRKFRPGETPGEIIDNVWVDISTLGSQDQERLGYATQKPLALMERIIKSASNPGDVVFDPFCGCATTLEAAHKLGRQWVGIDIAIPKRVTKVRLEERMHLKEGVDFVIEGVPRNLEGAKDLWERDKYHFQKWCIEQVDGFVTTKRTSDGGIDGRLYFEMQGEKDLQSMVVEVKWKNISIAKSLVVYMERDDAQNGWTDNYGTFK